MNILGRTVILLYRSNKCIQYPIWRQIQPMHCIHYIWRHWFWLANGYIRKPRVLSYVIKNSCRKVQQYSSWEKWIGLFIFIDLTKCAPQFETASRLYLWCRSKSSFYAKVVHQWYLWNSAEHEKGKPKIFPVFRRFGLIFPVFLPFMIVLANVRTRYSKISAEEIRVFGQNIYPWKSKRVDCERV